MCQAARDRYKGEQERQSSALELSKTDSKQINNTLHSTQSSIE